LPVMNVSLDTIFYVNVAYTKFRFVFKNNTGSSVTASFVLPTEGTVTSISASIGEGRFVESSYISTKDATTQGFMKNEASGDVPKQKYIPGCFRIQLPEIPINTVVVISIQVLEDLEYHDGHFHFRFPLSFIEGVAPPNVPARDWLRINAKINCILPNIRYGSESHQINLVAQEGNKTILSALIKEVQDFHLSY